ncbi:MAG: respiratory nitrate reductase subunit gamma [Thermoleophilia bacterium]
MSRPDLLLWVALPYVAATVFVVGHIWRYRHDQVGWTARSTQLLERRRLRAAVLLFHVGFLMVLGGHVLGILVPASVTSALGLSEHHYHQVSVTAGTIAGVLMGAGLLLLAVRRGTHAAVRVTTTNVDRLVYLLLALMLITGMVATVGKNLLGGGYDYRATVAPWFRGLLTLHPDTAAISGAPLVYRLHTIVGWLLILLWPFSRLVHAWSVPLSYPVRSAILYRSRRRTPLVPARDMTTAP